MPNDLIERAVAAEGAQTPGEALTVPTDVADPAAIKSLRNARASNWKNSAPRTNS